MYNWEKNIPFLKIAAAPRSPFSTGDLVKFCGEACLVEAVNSALGYNQYSLVALDTGVKLRAFGYQLTRLSTVSDALQECFEEEWSLGDVKLPGPHREDDPTSEPRERADSRWANRTDEEVTELAKNRHSDKTAKQTAWAVKLFRGGLNIHGLYNCSWASCSQKFVKMKRLNDFCLFLLLRSELRFRCCQTNTTFNCGRWETPRHGGAANECP